MSTSDGRHASSRFTAFARFAAVAVGAIGAVVIAGWAFDVAVLRSFIPGMTAMNPGGTAVALMLSGASLWLRTAHPGRRARAAALACAVAVVVLSGLRLGTYLLDWDFGTDRLLFPEKIDAEAARTGHVNRMAPNTAASMLLVGLALALMDVRSRAALWATQALELAAGLIALLALIGYAYSALHLVGIESYIPMALATAIALGSSSAGLLAARPDRGMMAVVGGEGAGGVLARRLLPAVIVIPAVLGWVRWLAQREGLMDHVMGLSLYVVANIVVFTALIWWTAETLERMDRQRRRADRRLRIQHAATRVLADASQLDEAARGVLWSICDGLGWAVGSMWWVDRRADLLRCRHAWFPPDSPFEEFAEESRRTTLRARSRPAGAGVGLGFNRTGSATSSPNRTSSARRWRRGAGLHTALGLPIAVGGEVLGILEVFSDEVLEPDDDLVVMLGAVGSQLGQFLKRSQAELALRHGEMRFRSLIEATAAIVWNTPASGEFEEPQPGWTAFTGQGFDELKGWGWLDAVHPDDREQTARAWSVAVRDRSLYQVEHRILRHDGEYRHMLVRAVPILGDDRLIREWVGVHTDIDAEKRAEEATREARDAAEAATRAKSEFLANMSHEIRTPLNGIIGMTELTLETELTAEQREYLGMVKLSADHLLSVVNDVLDFSKIEAGKLELEAIEFEPARDARRRDGLAGDPRTSEGPGAGRPHRPRRARVPRGRPAPAAAGRRQPAGQRDQVHRARRGRAGRLARIARRARAGPALRRPGHRDRGLARRAGEAIPGVHAGGHLDDAEIRRDGPGPGDLGAAGGDDGGRDLAGEHARRGEHVPFHGAVRGGERPRGPADAAAADAAAWACACWSWTTMRPTGGSSRRRWRTGGCGRRWSKAASRRWRSSSVRGPRGRRLPW